MGMIGRLEVAGQVQGPAPLMHDWLPLYMTTLTREINTFSDTRGLETWGQQPLGMMSPTPISAVINLCAASLGN